MCDDGNGCNGVETCNPASGCVAGVPVVCAAPEPCRDAGTCVGGVCHAGGPVTCADDSDACTVEVCNPASGCHKTVNMDVTLGSFSEHRVDGRDLVVLANAWNRCYPHEAYSAAADLDPVLTPLGATCVDDADFHLFMNAFGRTCAP